MALKRSALNFSMASVSSFFWEKSNCKLKSTIWAIATRVFRTIFIQRPESFSYPCTGNKRDDGVRVGDVLAAAVTPRIAKIWSADCGLAQHWHKEAEPGYRECNDEGNSHH